MKTLPRTSRNLENDEKRIIDDILKVVGSLDVKKATQLLERAQMEIGSKAESVQVLSLMAS